VPVQDEEGQQEPALAPRQQVLTTYAVDLRGEATADLQPGRTQEHDSSKVAPRCTTYSLSRRRSVVTMAKLIRCECGYIARGDDDEQVVSSIETHMRSDHPAVLAGMDRAEIFDWIEEG
jgi:predicted small metal-binding protein